MPYIFGSRRALILNNFITSVSLPIPIPEATFLPSFAGVTLSIAYGIRNMVAGNTSPLIQIMKSSDTGTTTFEVPQLPDGRCDDAAILGWAGNDETRISKFYNHTGNGLDTVAMSWAIGPIYDAKKLYGEVGKHGPFTSAMFDGWLRTSNNTRYPKYFELPAAFNLPTGRQNISIFDVCDPKSALYNTTFWSLSDTFGGTNDRLGATLASGLTGFNASSFADASTPNRARQNYQVLGIVNNAAACRLFQDDQIFTRTAKGSGAIIGGVVGAGLARATGNSDFLDRSNRLGYVVYSSALTDAQAQQVIAALKSNFGLKTYGTGSQIIMNGDSNHTGATVSESLAGRILSRETRDLLKFDADWYNMALSSQTLLGSGQMAEMAATREDLLLAQGTYTERMLISLIGGNDLAINGNTPGFATTLYNAHAAYIADKRSKGATDVIIGTIPPRSSFLSGQSAIEWANYNTLVRANTAGADRVADFAAHPIIGDPATLTNPLYWQGDNVHWTGLGNHLLAPILAQAITELH